MLGLSPLPWYCGGTARMQRKRVRGGGVQATQQRTGWPIGRKEGQGKWRAPGECHPNTNACTGNTGATGSQDSWVALKLHARHPLPGRSSKKGKESNKQREGHSTTQPQRAHHEKAHGERKKAC